MNDNNLPLPNFRCPKCESKLEQTAECLDEERYIDVYKCSKCDYLFRHFDRIYFAHQRKIPLELSIKKTLAKYSGDIGEKIAQKFLVNQNFKVVDFTDYLGLLGIHFEIKSTSDRRVLESFFGKKYLQKFIDFCKAWSEDLDAPSGKITKARLFSARWQRNPDELYRNYNFGPDYIGKKKW